MKISRLEKLGSFGVYSDDIDMDHMTQEQWHEIGQLFIKELVVVLRNINMSKPQFVDWIQKFGPFCSDAKLRLVKKYGHSPDAKTPDTWGNIDAKDKQWLHYREHTLEDTGDGRFVTRVYGRTLEDGRPLGYFSSGDLHWHSNESSCLTFAPCVALLGWQKMAGSSTGFLQTVDLYESFSASFQSELDEMVMIHRFEAGRVNDRELIDPDLAEVIRRHFVAEDGAETPLVCTAPNGRKGLHYTVNTRAEIKNMSKTDTQRLFDELDKKVFDNKWIFDHWWTDTKDLCLFDNSVTLHRRIGGDPDRKAFRLQFDPSLVLDQPWTPWQHQSEFHDLYIEQSNLNANILGGHFKQQFKMPKLML